MNLREKAQKFLEQNNKKRSSQIEFDAPEEEWVEIRESLDQNIKHFLDKHAENIQKLKFKEVDVYRML